MPTIVAHFVSTIAYDYRHFVSTIVHDCLRLSSFCDESSPSEKEGKKCTIVDDCLQIPESGPKPPFESPNLDFPDLCGSSEGVKLPRESGRKKF